jgi:aspartyl-tRNA(Asn)/glutamyl-tRNA(Gln) amidotransferase subunit A
MTEPRTLSVYQAAAAIRKGKLTAEALVASCLERIQAREPAVKAWVRVHGEDALARARGLDRKARRDSWEGALHGIPLGVKDIFDVHGMETRAGTAAYPARLAEADAECIAPLRRAGAIFLGKTQTTAFAYGDPAPTRNPWNLTRTPGGSSAGSAAAVADRMCLAALGTQTAGSVLRPASYNGVVGFKPTFGAIGTGGVIPLSWQLDHIGVLARDVVDAHLFWELMRTDGSSGTEHGKLPRPLTRRAPKRIWRVRGLFEREAGAESLAALEAACRAFAKQGAKIVELDLPPSFEGVLESHQCILVSEAAVAHREGFAAREALYPPRIAECIREGRGVLAQAYVSALRHRLRATADLEAVLDGVDVALTPSTVAAAPSPETTGPRIFQAPWSFCGLPTITLPAGLSPEGLPLGVQLIAGRGREEPLFRCAAACEAALDFSEHPA